MHKKEENKKDNLKKTIESFNNAPKEQRKEFVFSLEKALNFNPKKDK